MRPTGEMAAMSVHNTESTLISSCYLNMRNMNMNTPTKMASRHSPDRSRVISAHRLLSGGT